MNNFNFGEVLTKAWQIIWKNKVLWIFGILAGCSSGHANFNSNFGSNSGYRADNGDFSGLSPEMQRQAEQFGRMLEQTNWTVIAIGFITLICVIMLVSIVLGTLGRIGLIKGAAQADAGRASLALGELWGESLPYFWRVFWLNLLVGLPFFVLILAIVVGGLIAVGGVAGVAEAVNNESVYAALIPLLGGAFLLMCCIGLISIVIQFIVNQAYNAIILEEHGIVEGFTRGWDVIVKNIGPMLLMGVIIYIIQIVIGFIVAIPAFLILLPIIVGSVAIGTGAGGVALAPIALGVLCLCLYAPIAWIISGVLEAYSQSVWTLTFLRLTVKPQAPVAPLEIAQAQ